MSEVVTHQRFAPTGERAEELRRLGVDLSQPLTPDEIKELKLYEPVYKEERVGELTPEEGRLFHEMWRCKQELEDRGRTAFGDALARMGGAIRESDRARPMHELLEEGEIKLSFGDDAAAEVYFRLSQRVAYLHALFYWLVGERLGKHQYRLGVRSGLRVVTVEKRY